MKLRSLSALFIFSFFTATLLFSQEQTLQQRVDSLRTILAKQTADTEKVRLLVSICDITRKMGAIDSALSIGKKARELAKKINWKKGEASAAIVLGRTCMYSDQFAEALNYANEALNISQANKDRGNEAQAYCLMADVLANQQEKEEKLLGYYNKALKLFTELGDKQGMALAHNSIGIYYNQLGEYERSLEHHLQVLILKTELKDSRGIADAYIHISEIKLRLKDPGSALSYAQKAMDIYVQIKDERRMAEAYDMLASIYYEQGNYSGAEKMYQQALAFAKRTGNNATMGNCYFALADLYAQMKRFDDAYHYFIRFHIVNDSIRGASATRQVIELKQKIENENAEKIRALEQSRKTELDEQEKRLRETKQFWIGLVCLVIVISLSLFAFVLARRFKAKKLANIEISRQKEMLEEKQKEILDSIHYAKRIQNSLLPTAKYMDRNIDRLKK